MVQVQHQQQLARRQQPPQVGRPQTRRLGAADPEVRLDVPAASRQPGCISGAIWPSFEGLTTETVTCTAVFSKYCYYACQL